MNDPAADADRLLDLAEAVCDDSASRNDIAELDALLAADPGARSRYLDYCRLHVALRLHLRARRAAQKACGQIGATPAVSAASESDVAKGDAQTPALPGFLPIAIEGTPGNFFSSGWPVAYLLATVVFGIGLLVGSLAYVSQPEQVARRSTPVVVEPVEPPFVGQITGMADCQWADPSTEPFCGARVPLGRKYAMAAGLMEITYDADAKVILEGPCTYQVESKNGGYLSIGRLMARVEKRGEERGEREKNPANRQFVNGNPRHLSPLSTLPSPFFSVRTPTAVVTDLGTEFGVEVNKEGNTTSHVFRGSVRVQTLSVEGKPEGVGRVLRENESVRVGGRGAGIVRLTSAESARFVREIPRRKVMTLDLVDIVAGGDGRSGRRDRGINPTTGRIATDLGRIVFPGSDGKYHRVAGFPFIDGVFVPKGRDAAVQLDSAGHTFAQFGNSDDIPGSALWAGGKLKINPPLPPPNNNIRYIPTVLDGVDYSSLPHGLLFVHANAGVTFDLEAIRRANRGNKLLGFRATTANTEIHSHLEGGANSADLWVFLDGRECFKRKNINGYSSAAPVVVPIGERNRYLTLVGTDGGNGIGGDWLMFGDPRLEMMCDSQTAPDLVPGTSQPISPKGEEVHRK